MPIAVLLPTVLAPAALWGFAEATLFFIVPDVIVGFLTLRFGLKAGLMAALAAALGAMLGGLALYCWAHLDPQGASAAVAALPAIDAAMIARVGASFTAGGYPDMLAGAFSGIAYKVFVLSAAGTGRSLPLFLAMTPLVRLPRFVLTAGIVAALDRLTRRRLGIRARMAALAGFWAVFYAWYFSVTA